MCSILQNQVQKLVWQKKRAHLLYQYSDNFQSSNATLDTGHNHKNKNDMHLHSYYNTL